jgi:hypothetical protein
MDWPAGSARVLQRQKRAYLLLLLIAHFMALMLPLQSPSALLTHPPSLSSFANTP